MTQVHHLRPDMKVKVAAHKCHSVKTAENVYCIKEKKLSSASTSSFLRTTMRNKDADFKIKQQPELKEEGQNEDDYNLKMLFDNCLGEDTPPSMSVVKERISGHSCCDGKHRAIYDKLRYWLRKKKYEPSELPCVSEQMQHKMQRYGLQTEKDNEDHDDEKERRESCSDAEADDESTVPTISSNATGRYKYSKKDNLMLDTVFKDLFKETSHSKHMLKVLTPVQLIDKIRSMRKACRRSQR